MNDVDLANMDQKDLEQLHLKSLKIMELREQQIIDAIHAFDINALKDALATNKDKILPPSVWNEIHISMHCLDAQSIDMFLFIKSLPQFEVQNSKTSSHTTITEQAICKAFFDQELLEFFYNSKEFSPILKKMAPLYAFVDNVPQEVIHKLFQLKILKPTKKIFNRVLEEDCFNYLEYFLDNQIYDLTQSDYKEIYLNIWSEDIPHILKKVKENLNGYNELPLATLIEKYYITRYGNVSDAGINHSKYVLFVGLDTEVFSGTLEVHKLTKNDFGNCIKAFISRENNIEENFHCLTQVVIKNYPDYYPILKSARGMIKSKSFLSIYNKAMQYADLNMTLEKNDVQEKRLKL